MCGFSWAVGWLEGEGSFMARKHKRSRWECGLQGTSTDEDVLLKVRQILGGRISPTESEAQADLAMESVFSNRVTQTSPQASSGAWPETEAASGSDVVRIAPTET